MYWFLAGILTGLVLSFLFRKLTESEAFNLVLAACQSVRSPTSKGKVADDAPTESPAEQRKAVAAQ